MEEAYGSIFKKASERYDAAIEGIHNPSVPKGAILKVYNEGVKKIKNIPELDIKGKEMPIYNPKFSTDPISRQINACALLGRKDKVQLLQHFGSPEAIAKASLEDLQKIMDLPKAQQVHRYLQKIPERLVINEIRQIPFLSDTYAQRLFDRFGSVDALKKASLADIKQLPGINPNRAEGIFRDLKNHLLDIKGKEMPIYNPKFSTDPISRQINACALLGRKDKVQLLQHFGSPEAIAKASLGDLQKIMHLPKAQQVHRYLQKIPERIMVNEIRRIPFLDSYAQKLFDHFGSIDALKKASLADIKQIPGINPNRVKGIFRDLKDYFSSK